MTILSHIIGFIVKSEQKKNSICFLLKYFLIIRVGFKFFFIDAADRNGMRYEFIFFYIGDESDSE